MRLAVLVTTLLLFAAALAPAQDSLLGRHRYPQFRVYSGLPGAGYGVLPNGTPSIDGAAALATPIAYTLDGHAALGVFNTNKTANPFKIGNETNADETSDGSLGFGIGGSYQGFRGYFGYFVLSRVGDSALNFQVAPPAYRKLTVALGVQDLAGGGGASGTNFPGDSDSSRSIYAVGTYDFGHRLYASAGIGERRFKKGFMNFSAPVVEHIRFTTEYDGFGFNSGFVINSAPLTGLTGRLSKAEASLFLGLVDEKYGTIGLTLTL